MWLALYFCETEDSTEDSTVFWYYDSKQCLLNMSPLPLSVYVQILRPDFLSSYVILLHIDFTLYANDTN